MNVEVPLELRLDGNASVNAYAQKMPVASLIVLKEDYEVVSHGVYTNQWTGEGCNCVLQYSPTLDTYRFVNPFGTGVNVLFTYDATTHFGTSVSKQLATGFVHPKEGNVYAKPAALNKMATTSTLTRPTSFGRLVISGLLLPEALALISTHSK